MEELRESREKIAEIFSLFYDSELDTFEIINTSRSDSDFREVVLIRDKSGKHYVIKLADNDFTFPEKIEMWEQTAGEYNKLGYFCPEIRCDKSGKFPIVAYKDRSCVVYAEEYSPYRSADTFKLGRAEIEEYEKQKWIMTAKIASKYLDYTEYPSGYCLFEEFCPSDATDEVLENALEWYRYAKSLPEELQTQIDRIWRLWNDNRRALEPVYKQLPTSVFQADLNDTNILLNENGEFVGIYDMNLCGRDVFLNYLMRENFDEDFEVELDMIFKALKIASHYYHFSDKENQLALMLYRCIKPLWYTRVEKLKALKDDLGAIQAFLDETEQYMTKEINFAEYIAKI